MAAYERDNAVVAEPIHTMVGGAGADLQSKQRFYVYRNQEVPRPAGFQDADLQRYDVWSLQNTNAGNAGGVLYFMDGALLTQWTEVPSLDTKGYRKIVVRYYVEVQGPFDPAAACNYGFCGFSADSAKPGMLSRGWRGRPDTAEAHPIPWVAADGIGITKRNLRMAMRVGTRYKTGGSREYSFPDEPKGTGQMCIGDEAFGTHGCTWRQLGIAKAVAVDCVMSMVGKSSRLLGANHGTVSKIVRSTSEALGTTSRVEAEKAAFTAAFEKDEQHGGCRNLLSPKAPQQKMPHEALASEATTSNENMAKRTNPTLWEGPLTLTEHARQKTEFFPSGHISNSGTFYRAG